MGGQVPMSKVSSETHDVFDFVFILFILVYITITIYYKKNIAADSLNNDHLSEFSESISSISVSLKQKDSI